MKNTNSDEEYFKKTARRVFLKTVSRKKKRLTTEKYIDYLERFGINLFEAILNLVVENTKEVDKINVEHLVNHAQKFIGKKISDKNAKLYRQIDNKLKERKEIGLSNNISEVVDIITVENKLSSTERERLYRNYIKYRKTTLRKVS